jgi:hypothetical protein
MTGSYNLAKERLDLLALAPGKLTGFGCHQGSVAVRPWV